MDNKTTDCLVYFAFDLLFLDGKELIKEPLRARKRLLQGLLQNAPADIRYSEHVIGNRTAWRAAPSHLSGLTRR